MEKLLFYTDEERKKMIDLYKIELEELDEELSLLSQKRIRCYNRLHEMLDYEKFLQSKDKSISLAYNQSWSTSKKAEYALEKIGKISTTRKMAEVIYRMEEGMVQTVSIADLVSNLGATLKQKVDKQDTFCRFSYGGDFFYSLLTWIDPNTRQIMPRYFNQFQEK